MFKVINGFVCTSGCDERLARKNVDPRNPHNDPVKQEQLDQKDPTKAIEKAIEDVRAQRFDPRRNPAADPDQAVLFGGSLQAENSHVPSTASREERLAAPAPGALVDVYA
jgi:hypothetical protein